MQFAVNSIPIVGLRSDGRPCSYLRGLRVCGGARHCRRDQFVRQSVAKPSISRSSAYGRSQLVALGGIPKRTFDLTIVGIALVLLTPILLATAGLIRILIGKPVLLAEGMIGLGGRRFARYRFRTALDDHPSFPPRGPQVRRSNHKTWIELFGECLRASDLDKLPQLFNVLRGDMSLVGPQLIAPENAQCRCAQAPEVLLARPGVTGMWRHAPRSLRTHATTTALDRHYVLHWSMWLDLKIVCGALARVHADDTATPAR